jgi:hypothetical protein
MIAFELDSTALCCHESYFVGILVILTQNTFALNLNWYDLLAQFAQYPFLLAFSIVTMPADHNRLHVSLGMANLNTLGE